MLLQSARTANLTLPRNAPLPQGVLVPKRLVPLVTGREGSQEAQEGASTATGAKPEEDSEGAERVHSDSQEAATARGPSTAQGQSTVTQRLGTVTRGEGQFATSPSQRSKSQAQGVFRGDSHSRQLLCLASLAGTITFHS